MNNVWTWVRKTRDRNRAIDRIVWTEYCESRGRAYGTACVCLYFVVGALVLSFAILGFGLTVTATRTISDLALPFLWIWERAPESIPLIVLLAYSGGALIVYANAGRRLARAKLEKGLVSAPLGR
ncbi:hypothetical protein RAS12_30905 (plasmid) [Achromobacter seleniivolatilans]|uniref:Uncharacterized protein n=1 Tax=Achromobacter seleniivolatilans TaxID=3047478 RepID=A0ABY9MAS2_9BURK|nr:hypothetical protein [Achromobacter sp. R39]WMD24044.1 hypothetical protein RAS12_30905 [Achromobacter sp. R39]